MFEEKEVKVQVMKKLASAKQICKESILLESIKQLASHSYSNSTIVTKRFDI